MKKASELVGATPSAQVRPVSLALRRTVFMFTKAHMAFAILSIGVVTGLFSADRKSVV